MPREAKIYRRLPERGMTLTHYVRLFQGPDHLLQVSSTGYSELYKRFYFRDIQAITILKTPWANVWTVILAVLTLGFLLPALDMSMGAAIVMSSIAGFLMTCLVIHLVLGPTCVCHIRTAVQTEKLPTLRRIKAARKTINRIKPFIVETQGQVSAEQLMERMQPGRTGSFQAPAPNIVQESIEAPPVISPESNPPAANA